MIQHHRPGLTEVYEELKRLARGYLRHETPGHTLQPTALVHEACLRLVEHDFAEGLPDTFQDRGHLIGVAARLMRQILVNHALRRRTAKRGGEWRRVPLDPAVALFESRCGDLVALDEALSRLAMTEPVRARVVELRFFGGLTVEECATVLGTSVRSVERHWTAARQWLRQEVECHAG